MAIFSYVMKIFICCSKYFYHKVAPIQKELEAKGHAITLPNSYGAPFMEEELKKQGVEAHRIWKSAKLKEQVEKILANEAILVLNFEKHGQENYVGGATFLEIFKAFELGKHIFFYNPIPEGMLRDELYAMNPKIINGDLSKVHE